MHLYRKFGSRWILLAVSSRADACAHFLSCAATPLARSGTDLPLNLRGVKEGDRYYSIPTPLQTQFLYDLGR